MTLRKEGTTGPAAPFNYSVEVPPLRVLEAELFSTHDQANDRVAVSWTGATGDSHVYLMLEKVRRREDPRRGVECRVRDTGEFVFPGEYTTQVIGETNVYLYDYRSSPTEADSLASGRLVATMTHLVHITLVER